MQTRWTVTALTGALSILSLALVFAAALQAIPPSLLPRAPDSVINAIPHVNAVVSAMAIGTIAVGWRAIRRENVARHRTAMLAATALFALFLTAYLYRVALEGPTAFAGPAVVERYVYHPVLAIHVALAVVAVPLVVHALVLAFHYPVSELPRTRHPRVGRVAAALWLVSFSLGIAVYALLYVAFQ